jgi:FtsP/CotA-like multicopper oxidase with cupredoxin domain
VAVPGAVAVLMLQAPVAHALECLPVSQPLVRIPELVARDGVLRGTMVLTADQQRMIFRSPLYKGNSVQPGLPGGSYQCLPQTVRAFRGLGALPAVTPGPGADKDYDDPVPGPTLRARVGDIIELTFVNELDPARFGGTKDQGTKNSTVGCDIVNNGAGATAGYPFVSLNPPVPGDTYPDCFHGSSTGNIHFHGTHTNPNGTGDNVLLEVRPSPRVGDKPTITPDTYKAQFDTFFAACESQLKRDPHSEWPTNWDETPLGPWTTAGTWTATQMSLLDSSDQAANAEVAGKKLWPQYYIGAYPYCFQLPAYKDAAFPPPPGGIKMGQSPGTHWYHAHKHGSTAIDVANGMVGAFIIEGKYDDDLNAFYGAGWARTQPVMVLNQLGVSPNLMRSVPNGAGRNDKGPDFSVNGRSQPTVDMAPGEVQLWRIVNGSGRSGAFLNGLPQGFRFRQLAQDGVQFADQNYKNSENKAILLAAGNRADLLVKAPPTPGMYPVLVQHEVDPSDLPSALPVVLLQVRVRGDVPPATDKRAEFIPTAPPQPPFLTNITDAEVVTSTDPTVVGTIKNPRVVTFATQNGPPFAQHTINGAKFDETAPPIPVTLNTVEEWKVVNATFGPLISHPFHIHLNPFQITEVFDPNARVQSTNGNGIVPKYVTARTPGFDDTVQCVLDLQNQATWMDCHNDTSNAPRVWWDVFPIPSGATLSSAAVQNVPVAGYFKLRSRFVDFPGDYVIHCHILAHEDRGMMTIVQLQPAGAPAPMPYHHH